jgi:hypothetical protein
MDMLVGQQQEYIYLLFYVVAGELDLQLRFVNVLELFFYKYVL